MILHDKTKQEFGYTWETASQYKNFYCICDYCGKEFLRCKKTIKQCNQTITKDSCGIGNCKKQKSEETNLKKYGVKNYSSTKEAQEKREKTCEEKYGKKHYTQTEQYKQDNIEKYGEEHHTKTQEWKDNIKEVRIKNFGVDHHTKDKKYQEEQVKKNREKWGVDHFMSTDWFKAKARKTKEERYGGLFTKIQEEKRRKTNLMHFGYEFPMQSPIIKAKVNEYFIITFGCHPSKLDETKKKVEDTFLKNYGVTSYSKTDEYKIHMVEINMANYGVKWYFQSEDFKNKKIQTCILNYGVDHYSKTKESKENYAKVCMERYGSPHPNIYGKAQKELQDWLNSFGFNFKSNSSILDGKEIDLYDENLKIGIEYNGLFFHTEASLQPRTKNYHYDKYIKCLGKGIRLISIFEDEWLLKNDQCKNYLKSVLKKFNIKIFARKCEVKEINKEIANNFYEENHILGKCKLIDVSFGIYYNNDLFGVVSLGKHHRQNNKNVVVLNRLCFKDGIQIAGGASKLFKKCIEWAKNKGFESIISWSDNRWTDGKIYNKLEFKLEKDYGPDYSYVDLKKCKKRISKQSQRKKITKCPPGLTEKEWCFQRGLARIWDCGKKLWIYKL